MILQALKEYYDRKPASEKPGEGFEKKELPFLIRIKPDGEFVGLEDTREKDGARLRGHIFLLPRSVGRSGSRSYEITFLLWDHAGYLLGIPEGDSRAEKQHVSWRKSLSGLPEALKADAGVRAIINFYEKNGLSELKKHPLMGELIKLKSCNMTFILTGDDEPVPCRPAVREYQRSLITGDPGQREEDGGGEAHSGICLVTGNVGEIAVTHGKTPINKDTKSLVAFQKNSGYDSYGKEQGHNAPVSKQAEFAYVTGLNMLLKSKRQKIKVGDASVVFWSKKESKLEENAFFVFSEPYQDDPDSNTEAVRALYQSVWNGSRFYEDDKTRFYVLGLSPNKARIAVRFWHSAAISEIGRRFQMHIDDLALGKAGERHPLPIQRLLGAVAVQGDYDNIPPNLAGETMRAILEGLPYPRTLLQAAVRRIRAEREITYPRAALIKATLNRFARYRNPENKEEIKVSLDRDNKNVGYRLGRLFAALEKVQEEANGNATIRDRFYGAASSTPVTVFGNLMRLKNHHLAKLDNPGRRVNFEKLLSEIAGELPASGFPAHLSLDDQGRFAIGYYHQMQDFYPKQSA